MSRAGGLHARYVRELAALVLEDALVAAKESGDTGRIAEVKGALREARASFRQLRGAVVDPGTVEASAAVTGLGD